MFNYRLTLAYDGTRYLGWQRQQEEVPKTIQGKVEAVLSKLFNEEIQIIGSGRTDAGVHAKCQTANFFAPTHLSCDEILNYLAQFLPKDICVFEVKEASLRFHARYNCHGKTYSYTIDRHRTPSPFHLKYAYHEPRPLDMAAIDTAIGYLLGSHDFKSFTTLKSKKKSTVKTIDQITYTEKDGFLTFYFTGNGFLQHMVRILTGTLLEVGLGIKSTDAIPEILAQKERSMAGFMAPGHGLCLEKVYYEGRKEVVHGNLYDY
jgi:tRNA pseudouridine38-40 synthase